MSNLGHYFLRFHSKDLAETLVTVILIMMQHQKVLYSLYTLIHASLLVIEPISL
jgi:hypothetical protein